VTFRPVLVVVRWVAARESGRLGHGGFQRISEITGMHPETIHQGRDELSGMTQLDEPGLRANNVTDAGLVHLQNLTNLTGLYLGETKRTDKGILHLKRMTKMDYLLLIIED